MNLEDGFERFARACGEPSILLCDRGLMDGSVYMPPEEWDSLVSEPFPPRTKHAVLLPVSALLPGRDIGSSTSRLSFTSSTNNDTSLPALLGR